MEWFYFYLLGCVVNIIAITAHFAFGYITLSSILITNYKKIGIHISYMGGIGLKPKNNSQLVVDILFSWIAVAMNILALASRILAYVKFMLLPDDVKKISYNMSAYNLTPEEVLVLELKARSNVIGLKFTVSEIDEVLSDEDRWYGLNINKAKVYELLNVNELIKKESA